VSGQAGEFSPLYCTAHGKALLADCGIDDLKVIFGARQFQRYTPRTIVSVEHLAKACAKIHSDGFALDDGEFRPELRCLAAPIRDKDGIVIASMGISAPRARFPKERFASAARQARAVANQIGALLDNLLDS
jgi:IclR family transcriptional regulator, acetate operon repressor